MKIDIIMVDEMTMATRMKNESESVNGNGTGHGKLK